jgi:hypothetical protein
VLGASLTSQRGIARIIKLASHIVEVQITTKCIELGEGHGIECPIKMKPSIKPTRLLEGHAIEDEGGTRHGDIGHITMVHI